MVQIYDQHASRDLGDLSVPQQSWLAGDIVGVYDELDALRAASNVLIGSLQNPDRSMGYNYPQYQAMWSEYWKVRRNVLKNGQIGRNTQTLTSVQIEDLFASWTNKTSGNDPAQQVTRARFATYDPDVLGGDTKEYLWFTLDRDADRDEVNTWTGKHSAADPETGEPEHNPRWVHWPDDLVTPGQIQSKLRPSDTPTVATKADVLDPGRIFIVPTPQSDAIVRTRPRTNGMALLPNRIDAGPVRRKRQG